MSTRGSSFRGTSGSLSQEATEDCTSLISSRKLKVTLLSCEWGSTKGGLSTINRELAIQLAKNDNVEVSMYLPQCSEEDERAAAGFSVCLLKAKKKPGFEPIDWLASIPRDHRMDVVIGHGIHLGRQVPHIRELHHDCKWIQVVHTDPEELAMFKDYAGSTVKGAKKHQTEVELCKLADQVVGVGPKLTESFGCYLSSCEKDQDVINLTPGIFSEFVNISQGAEERGTFRVLVFGRGDSEDFHLKGYDIAARAVAQLKGEERSFKLVFVGAPNGEEEKVRERFLREGISPNQLIVRSAKEREKLGEQFCQADLVIMPSRTEGFGLAALEALSAGLPVLVSHNSGIGEALKKVPYGSNCVVNSEFSDEDPVKWAEAIKAVCRKERKVRLKEAILLRQNYAETYQWEEQCSILVEKMLEMIKVAGGKKKELCPSSPEDIKPPQLSFKLKKAGDVPKSTETWSDDHLPIDILLLSVESCDFLSCFSFLNQPFKSYKKEIGVVYFGRMGDASDQDKLKVALMNCFKGAATPVGSLTVVQNAVRVLRPKAVFSVGTCISLGLKKVRMGDVVISSKVTAEGCSTPVSPLLGYLIQDAPYGWVAPLKNPGELEIKVHCDGDILSRSLTEKCQYDDICEQYPGAVAIETEAEGVYAATAYDANIEWVIVKGVASYFHQSQSATSEWISFASTMAASVVAKMLNDPTVFVEWPHYNQETSTVPHQAVAANYLGYQGTSAIPETVQQHPLDAVLTSCIGNGRQGVHHGGSGDQHLSLREYGESYVKVLISTRNLEKEKEEAMKEMLTQEVHSYLKFNDHSGDELPQAITSFTVHLINVYKVRLVTLGVNSVFIILDCPTLGSLEHLWSDYLSGHLDKVAERYLVSDEIKKKLNLQTICLKTTIAEENYLNCKKALMERPSTCSAVIDNSFVIQWLKGEYKRRAEFGPLLWSKGMKLQLKDLFARLSVVSSLHSESSQMDVDDIFGSFRKGENSLVLLVGSPGIGKTFFCLKLAHDWANGAMPSNFPTFELVLLLKCRDIEGDIMEAISEQLLPRYLEEKTRENFLNFLGDVSNQERILVILDGLNELPEKSKHHVENVLARRVLNCCYLMVITQEGPELRKQFKFDICLEMKVLSEDDSFEYIRKHFRNIETAKSSKGESLIEEIKRNRLLQALQSTRPNLFLLCLVYEDHEGELPSCSSELYQTLVRYLWRRYWAKLKLEAVEEDVDLAKKFERGILGLGELAWKCLLNDRHYFREDELELERSDKKSIALGLGFVHKEESLKRLKPNHVYSFLHKTFQDYLAASYIAHNLRGSEFHVLGQVRFPYLTWKFQQVFLFVCGIMHEEASILFTQIGDALQKHWDWSECSEHAASFFIESWKESGNAERMAGTLCSFLPFPRVLHVSEYHYKDLINVLEACAGFSKVGTPAEVHVTIPPGSQVDKNIQRVLAGVPNVKTLTLPAVSYSIDHAEIGEVLRASKTLEKVTFALSAVRGQGWASALDVGLGADASLSSVGLRIYGILNQSALQAVENLLFNKCLSCLSLTVCGDVQESLAEALARGLAGESAVELLDLCVNGKLSVYGAYSLKEGILRNESLRNVHLSVNGELPVNWQAVVENLHAQLAKKGIVSAIYPNTFSKVKGNQLNRLNRILAKNDLLLQNVTLNVWGKLSGDGSKAVCEVLQHTPVSHLTLTIHGQLTEEILRCTARCVKYRQDIHFVTINTGAQMTKDESNLTKKLGLDKNPSVLLNVGGTSSPYKESGDNKVISTDEPESLIAFFEKAEEVSSKSLSFTINNQTPDYSCTGSFWEHELGEGLAKSTSLNSLELAINNYSDTSRFWGYKLGVCLAKSTSLNSLTLAINNYGHRSRFWVDELGDGLAKSTSLNSLTLTINNYGYKSRFWVDELGDGLAKSTSLNSVTLAINNYSDSNNLWDYELLEGLAKSKSLTECNFIINICAK